MSVLGIEEKSRAIAIPLPVVLLLVLVVSAVAAGSVSAACGIDKGSRTHLLVLLILCKLLWLILFLLSRLLPLGC